MIVNLRGELEEVLDGGAVVNAGGIGFYLSMPVSSLKRLGKPGSEVKLYTRLFIRDDGPVLYGFISREEVELFRFLLGVSGIGPRTALGILSAADVGQIAAAIVGGDVEWLSRMPGIGRKTAERLVLELRDKMGGFQISDGAGSGRADGELVAALMSLGYSLVEARRALAALPRDMATIEDKLKWCLGYLASMT